MNEALKLLLSLSLSGTLLLLLVFLAKPLYRNRLSRRWQYYIWLVVALRFVLPFSSEHSFSNILFEKAEPLFTAGTNILTGAYDDSGNNSAAGPDDTAQKSSSAGTDGTIEKDPATDRDVVYETDTMAGPNAAFGPEGSDPWNGTAIFCIFFLWLAVASMLFARKITIYRNFLHFVKAAGTQVSDMETLHLLADCAARQRVGRKVQLYTSPSISSPVLTGILHPAILLPVRDQDISDSRYGEQLTCIFTHELIHCRRLDMLYRWFIQLVLCLHWFNPLVRLLEKETGKSCELACDEAVTQSLDEDGRRAYGNTLLAFLRTDSLNRNSFASVPLKEDAEDLKERLGVIMKSQKSTKIMALLALLATFVVGIAFGALGAYAKSGSTDFDNAEAQARLLYPWADENAPDGNSSSDNRTSLENDIFCEFDQDVFYIYTGGATRDDKPIVGFTDGSLGVILVRKDNYTALGPFAVTESEDFIKDITELCGKMTEDGSLTQKETDCILNLAEKIQDNFLYPEQTVRNPETKYSYVQRNYYQDSYIIGMGWNLSAETWPDYQGKPVEITLTNGASMNLYFSEDAKAYAANSDFLAAAAKLISALKENVPEGYPSLDAPLITNIRQAGTDSLTTLAEQAIQSGDISGFSALFPSLEYAEQERFCELLYADDNIAAFVSIIPFLEEELFLRFLNEADADGKTDFLNALWEAENFPESGFGDAL